MKAMICDLCKGTSFTKDGDFFRCDHCRTKYSLEEAKQMLVEGEVRIDRAGEGENFLNLAESALRSNNFNDTFNYATKALEINPRSSRAWWYRGKAMAKLSTFESFSPFEIANHFLKAASFSVGGEKKEIDFDAAVHLSDAGFSVYYDSLVRAQEFLAMPGEFERHETLYPAVMSAFEYALTFYDYRPALEHAIRISNNIALGLAQALPNGDVLFREYMPITRAHAEEYINWAEEGMRRHDSSFVAERKAQYIPENKKSDCFVVTATMGNDDSRMVELLRRFRTEILAQSTLGRSFITWYAQHGPPLAEWVRGSRLLRVGSFVFVVLPASGIAKLALWIRGR